MKYFGMIAESLGKEEETLDLDIKMVSDLSDYFLSEFSRLEEMNFQISVNLNIVPAQFELSENDEVALLPAFAGG